MNLRPHRAPLLALLCVLAAAPAAQAEDVDRLYEEGQAAFEAHDYKAAYEKLAAVWASRKSYDVAAVLAQAELQLGKNSEAAEHVSYAAAHFPVSAKTELRKSVEAMLAEVTAKVGTVRLKVTPESAAVTVNGRRYGAAERAESIFVEPGRVTVEAALEGYEPAKQSFDVKTGEKREVAVAMKKKETAPPPERSFVAPAIAFGIGGAGILVGAIAGGIVDAKKGEIVRTCGEDLVCPRSAHGEVDAARTAAGISTAGFIVAGVGAAVGVTLLLLPLGKRQTTVSATLQPGFLSVKGAF